MKVKCQRDSLLNACGLVGQAVASRTTKPILSNLKAVASDDALTLMATDLEIGIRFELRGVEVSRSGAAILPVSKLLPILRESNDAEITLDSNEDGTLIRTSTSRFNLPAGDPGDFPDIPGFDEDKYHEITAGVLRTLIHRTAFAADKKESGARWAVTGVLWEVEPNKVRLVATDTKRLAMTEGAAMTNESTAKETKPVSHLIPQKALQLLDRSLVDGGERIRVALHPNEAMFQTERALIYTKLVEGRFPPYRDIIPKKSTIKLNLPPADFLSRIRQAAIMTDDETKRVEFEFTKKKLVLKAEGAETGSSEVTLALPDFDGDEVTIAFDPQYLIEMLRAIEGETVITLEMTNGEKPAVFRAGDNYLYLVMPLAG